MTVASYERDPATGGCLFPVVPKNHLIKSTCDHYLDAPRTTSQPAEPQATKPTQQSP